MCRKSFQICDDSGSAAWVEACYRQQNRRRGVSIRAHRACLASIREENCRSRSSISGNVPANANLRARFASRNKNVCRFRARKRAVPWKCGNPEIKSVNSKIQLQIAEICVQAPTAAALFRWNSESQRMILSAFGFQANLLHTRPSFVRTRPVFPTDFFQARMHARVQCAPFSSNPYI